MFQIDDDANETPPSFLCSPFEEFRLILDVIWVCPRYKVNYYGGFCDTVESFVESECFDKIERYKICIP